MEMRQIAGAMDHLHSKKVLHRDLKSANVLVAEDGRLVVADFGLARYCRECWRVEPHIPPTRLRCLAVPLTALCLWWRRTSQTQTSSRMPETRRNPSLTSAARRPLVSRWIGRPQVIRHEPYGTGCDVYSFGVLCWEMLSYSIPFPQHTPVEVALSVATKGMRPEIPAHSPRDLVDLIEQCWQQQALLRPSFAKVRRAPRRAAAVLSPPFALRRPPRPRPSASPPPRLAPTPAPTPPPAPALLEPCAARHRRSAVESTPSRARRRCASCPARRRA